MVDMEEIKNSEEIKERIGGEADELTKNKIENCLSQKMIDFISSSRMLMLSTIDDQGFPTISPKGIEINKLLIKDNTTLIIPERRGNKLAFSLNNIVNNNKVGIIFITPGVEETLRVHGECSLYYDREICDKLTASRSGKALLLMHVDVKTAYFHCPKAFIWGEVWKPMKFPDNLIYILSSYLQRILGKLNSLTK